MFADLFIIFKGKYSDYKGDVQLWHNKFNIYKYLLCNIWYVILFTHFFPYFLKSILTDAINFFVCVSNKPSHKMHTIKYWDAWDRRQNDLLGKIKSWESHYTLNKITILSFLTIVVYVKVAYGDSFHPWPTTRQGIHWSKLFKTPFFSGTLNKVQNTVLQCRVLRFLS